MTTFEWLTGTGMCSELIVSWTISTVYVCVEFPSYIIIIIIIWAPSCCPGLIHDSNLSAAVVYKSLCKKLYPIALDTQLLNWEILFSMHQGTAKEQSLADAVILVNIKM